MYVYYQYFNSLPNDKTLQSVKIQITCRQQSNRSPKIEICFETSRKHCGEKGENAGYQHFLLFPQ